MRCCITALTCPGVTALKGLSAAITCRPLACSLTTHRAALHNSVDDMHHSILYYLLKMGPRRSLTVHWKLSTVMGLLPDIQCG